MEADWWPRCCRNSRKRQPSPVELLTILTTSARGHGDPCSLSAPLVAASGTLVLLDVVCLRRCDADTVTMVPLLANVTANPEFFIRIPPSTCTAQVSLILVASIFFDDLLLLLWRRLLCWLAVRIGFLGWQELKGKCIIRNLCKYEQET